MTTGFVAYAGDQWYLHRRQDEAGRFFWKVAQQGHYKDRPEDETRQGLYAAAPDGTLLGSINSWSPEKTAAMLTSALDRWEREPRTPTEAPTALTADAHYVREPPAGGMILDVFSRIPLPPDAAGNWSPNQATGRDHLWLTREEWRSLLPEQWQTGRRYPVPPAVAERLLRFHLVDNVRGEPPGTHGVGGWTRAEIRQADMELVVEDATAGRLRLEGTARMHTADAEGEPAGRGYDARLQGAFCFERGQDRFTRVDLLAWGEAWGEGRYTGGAPRGRFPLVIAASLAGDTPADHVPPQGSRSLKEYFGTDR